MASTPGQKALMCLLNKWNFACSQRVDWFNWCLEISLNLSTVSNVFELKEMINYVYPCLRLLKVIVGYVSLKTLSMYPKPLVRIITVISAQLWNRGEHTHSATYRWIATRPHKQLFQKVQNLPPLASQNLVLIPKYGLLSLVLMCV